jgi:hypothetical protein
VSDFTVGYFIGVITVPAVMVVIVCVSLLIDKRGGRKRID